MKHVFVALVGMLFVMGCSIPSRFDGPVEISHWGVVRAIGQYEAGEKTGEWTYFDAFGRVQGTGTYKDGKMVDGLEVVFAINGQKLSEGAWTDGKKDGDWVEYFRSGNKRAEGSYIDDKKTGLWREYDPSGFYVVETIWEEGKIESWGELKQGRIGNPL